MQAPFVPGDTVRLLYSGGELMLVSGVDKGTARCAWVDEDGEDCRGVFKWEHLVLVREAVSD